MRDGTDQIDGAALAEAYARIGVQVVHAGDSSAIAETYHVLHEMIVTDRLSPGERLIEEDLSRDLAVGRAAIRTALVRLEQDGLVVRERNRGARVRRVREAEAVEILEARAALEGLAARCAAERATPDEVAELRALSVRMRERHGAGDLLGMSELNSELHTRVLEISRHTTAARLCAGLSSQLVRYQYRTVLLPGRADRSLAEHEELVGAIAAGDADASESAMRRHLSHVADALRRGASAPSLR